MRIFSIISLIVVLGLGGFLMMKQLESSNPKTEESAPASAIEKANDAAETVEKQTDKLQKDLNQP